MKDLKVTLIRQASEALQLYGSVTSRDIADAANAAGVKVERSQVVLDKPIKTLGLHQIKVHLHPEVTVEITALVARSRRRGRVPGQGRQAGRGDRARRARGREAAQRVAEQAAALFEAKSAAAGEQAAEPAEEEADAREEIVRSSARFARYRTTRPPSLCRDGGRFFRGTIISSAFALEIANRINI